MIPRPFVLQKPSPLVVTAMAGVKTRRVGRRNILYSARPPRDTLIRFEVKYSAGTKKATIGPGRVNDYLPELNGFPITGRDGKIPELEIQDEYTSICIKITPNPETGRLDMGDDGMAGPGQLTITTQQGPLNQLGPSWFQEIARVSLYGFLQQTAFFNYYYVARRVPGESNLRHFISLDSNLIRTIDDTNDEQLSMEAGDPATGIATGTFRI